MAGPRMKEGRLGCAPKQPKCGTEIVRFSPRDFACELATRATENVLKDALEAAWRNAPRTDPGAQGGASVLQRICTASPLS